MGGLCYYQIVEGKEIEDGWLKVEVDLIKQQWTILEPVMQTHLLNTAIIAMQIVSVFGILALPTSDSAPETKCQAGAAQTYYSAFHDSGVFCLTFTSIGGVSLTYKHGDAQYHAAFLGLTQTYTIFLEVLGVFCMGVFMLLGAGDACGGRDDHYWQDSEAFKQFRVEVVALKALIGGLQCRVNNDLASLMNIKGLVKPTLICMFCFSLSDAGSWVAVYLFCNEHCFRAATFAPLHC